MIYIASSFSITIVNDASLFFSVTLGEVEECLVNLGYGG